MRAKLGLVHDHGRDDDKLIAELLTLMDKARADYTLAFRNLSDAGEGWPILFAAEHVPAVAWLARYRARMAQEGDRSAAMAAVNPKYVLRNWVAEVAIRAVEDEGDSAPLDRILRLLQSPYDSHSGDEAFAAPPAPEFGGLCVSCSS